MINFFTMNTLAIIFGLGGLIAYFFFYIVGRSSSGDDGQGVNQPIKNDFSSPLPSAAEQKGQWD